MSDTLKWWIEEFESQKGLECKYNGKPLIEEVLPFLKEIYNLRAKSNTDNELITSYINQVKDLRAKLETEKEGIKVYKDLADALKDKLDAAETALNKINDIRNSIVGLQTINWSEHIYPLVAALNETGLQGLHYPEARKYYGTMLERTVKAEKECDQLKAANGELKKALEKISYRILIPEDNAESLIAITEIADKALSTIPPTAYERLKRLEEVYQEAAKVCYDMAMGKGVVLIPLNMAVCKLQKVDGDGK